MDKLLDFTKKEFDILPDLNVNATEATFKIYGTNELLKKYINPEDKDLEKIDYLIYNYGNKLKTKMPDGVFYIDEIFSGAILYNFQDAYKFASLKKCKCIDLKISRLKTLRNRLIELCSNNLYPTDLHSSNVLLTKKELAVQIIDIDRDGLDITDKYDDELYHHVTYEYMKLVLEILFEEYKPILSSSIFRTTKVLEKYGIYNAYIDCIINKNTNFAFAKDFIEYVQKDNKLIKKY